MVSTRTPYTVTEFRGMHDQASPLDHKEFVRNGYLSVVENYHLDRGMRKRQGHRAFTANPISAGDPVQGLAMYQWDTTRELIGLANGQLKQRAGDNWNSITGALVLPTAASARLRTCQFHDGADEYIIGCTGAGTNPPFAWSGAGNATAIGGAGTPPAFAADCAEFKDFLFFINTPAGPYALQHGGYGVLNDWPLNNNLIDCTRSSIGVGLIEHGQEVLLAFYQHSIHRITFNYDNTGTANYFAHAVVDGTVGTSSRDSIVGRDGYTYFAGGPRGIFRGFYRIGDPRRRAQYLSEPIEGFLSRTTRSAANQVVVLTRGSQQNEVIWLMPIDGSSDLNAAAVFNTQKEGWSIFTGLNNALHFNAGGLWVDTNGEDVTLVGGYDGSVFEAWGDDQHSTGFADDTEDIRCEFLGGFTNMGANRVKGIREAWMDIETTAAKNFLGRVDVSASAPQATGAFNMGASQAPLGSFVLGQDPLAGNNLWEARMTVNRQGRYARLGVVEQSKAAPHVINSYTLTHKAQGVKLQ